MKILFNLASLASPKTGIGHYTQHLLDGVVMHPHIEDVAGIKNRTIWSRAQLSKIKDTPTIHNDALSRDRSGSILIPSALLSKLKKWLRPWLRALPGAYKCRTFIQERLSKSARLSFARKNFIYHETNYIPNSYLGKMVISVHDLSHIRHPEYHPKERVEYLNSKLPKALQRADKIITCSEFSRQELLECFAIDANKVITVWDGVDEQFMPREEKEVKMMLDKYGIRYHQYILSVCTIEPRKNLVRLLKAFSLLPAELRKAYPIVLVGGKGWHNREILDLITPLLDLGELVFTGYIPQEDLPQLYSGAKIFAYPSLYEGFGLPVLEAMASGVPVVTSNNSSLPEVSAGAAIEVDPLSVTAISNALLRLLEDPDLAKDYILKGLERAKLLTWDRCVEKTLGVYRSVN